MKVKLKNDANPYTYGCLKPEIEYQILGIDSSGYFYIYNDAYEIDLISKNSVEITDDTIPDFWEIDERDHNRLVPSEWHWKNFLSLNEEPHIEIWNYDIWLVTQFAKGFKYYDFPIYPVNFRRAVDIEYKIDIINAHFKMAEIYDSLKQGDFCLSYVIRHWKNFNIDNLNLNDHKILTKKAFGFNVLINIVDKYIGLHLASRFNIEEYEFDGIRKTISYSIWSLLGTNDFEIIELLEREHSHTNYVLTNRQDSFILKFDWYT